MGNLILCNKLDDETMWLITPLSMSYLLKIVESIWDKRQKGMNHLRGLKVVNTPHEWNLQFLIRSYWKMTRFCSQVSHSFYKVYILKKRNVNDSIYQPCGYSYYSGCNVTLLYLIIFCWNYFFAYPSSWLFGDNQLSLFSLLKNHEINFLNYRKG